MMKSALKKVLAVAIEAAGRGVQYGKSWSKRGFAWLKGHRENLAYYAILALVLTALGTAASDYRNGTWRKKGTEAAEPEATFAPHVETQALPAVQPPEPFLAPVSGEIVGKFAAEEMIWSEAMGMWQTHPAVDFAASAGETVIAMADGTVLEAYADALYGNVIVIDHGDGKVARYASLSTLQLVKAGQEVARGEVISAAGTCPCEPEMGAHVHVEFYENGVPTDLEEQFSTDEEDS